MDSEGKPAYDGPAHGPGCALQTNNVHRDITNMCFRRDDDKYVSHSELLVQNVKLLGSKRIVTCQDSGKRDGGTRRLIPLLMYYALIGGYPKVIQFI